MGITSTQRQAIQIEYKFNPKWSVSGTRNQNGGFGHHVSIAVAGALANLSIGLARRWGAFSPQEAKSGLTAIPPCQHRARREPWCRLPE
jgi:hypothetical protein